MPDPIKILLVEDNPGDARLIEETLSEDREIQFVFTLADRLDLALASADQHDFDIVLLDLTLPDSSGLATLERLHSQSPVLPIIVLTGLDATTLGTEALQKGAQDYLSKGQVDAPLLVRSIRYAIERKLLENQLVQANASLSRTNQEMEALFNIASILVEPGEFESKATKVMDRLAELTGAEWVTLRMQRGAKPGLQLVAAAGSAVSSSPPMPVLTDKETLAYRALREGVLIVANDYPSEHNASPTIVALEMKSMVLIPIKAGDQSLGLVNVCSRKPNHFTPDLVRLLSAITDEIGVLLENASLAQQVRDKTVELESFNERLARLVEERTAELESFSYSVSHDLRSPLRSINGFGQALYEDYSEQLDDQGKDYLERVRASTQKMELLIDGLLELARLSRSEIRTREINLSELANSIASDLAALDPGRDVKFSIQDCLVVNGDPRLLRVVLENLLGNAWKYTAKQSTALIEFGVDTQNGDKVYFVRDDGAGFDMAYRDKLFGAFQRLHAVSEFEGTGIGLATVQRIVQRHSGVVWAHGQVGHGATFYFTLGSNANALAESPSRLDASSGG